MVHWMHAGDADAEPRPRGVVRNFCECWLHLAAYQGQHRGARGGERDHLLVHAAVGERVRGFPGRALRCEGHHGRRAHCTIYHSRGKDAGEAETGRCGA